MSTYKDEITGLSYEGEIIKSVQKAIKAKCLDCCAFQRDEVKLCTSNSCPLWPFRNGKNPYKAKKVLTEEQKEANRARLKKARERKLNSK